MAIGRNDLSSFEDKVKRLQSSHLAPTHWGGQSGCLLEEVLLSSASPSEVFNLEARICSLHGWGPRYDKLHLLA